MTVSLIPISLIPNTRSPIPREAQVPQFPVRGATSSSESWREMVLRAMPPPAWLSSDAPQGDVVLSSRARVMRNLRGHRFPHHASDEELRVVLEKVVSAAQGGEDAFSVQRRVTQAERDYLVGSRLASHDFHWNEPGRALLLDEERSRCVMVNEEDHLRVQCLSAGWSIEVADARVRGVLENLGSNLDFAWTPEFGFLSASPFNAGEGRRLSAMLHLIGLAQGKRLPSVLKALSSRGLAARGLFGEASRAVGAFVQVSISTGTRVEFVGACEYLLREERDARAEIGRGILEERARQAVDFAVASRSIGLADALRVLAWVRWASSAEIQGFPESPREVDRWLTMLEVRGNSDAEAAARERAAFLRNRVER